MSNGVDFRKMAVELRGQLTAAEIDLTTWKTKACEAAEREAALRDKLAEEQLSCAALASGANLLQQRLATAEQRNTFRDRDAGRYRKLQLWMASNVKEGWEEVEKMGGICAWMSCEDMDEYLDRLPDCNVGLCEKPTESGASKLDPKIIGIVPMPPMEYDEP